MSTTIVMTTLIVWCSGCFYGETTLARPVEVAHTPSPPKKPEPLTLDVRGRILVFDLTGSSTTDRISDALRRVVESKRLVLSKGERRDSWRELGLAKCNTTPRGDGVCMGRRGAMLKADWILWGYLTDLGDHVKVEAQIIQTAGPTNNRSIGFDFKRDDDLDNVARRIWSELVRLGSD